MYKKVILTVPCLAVLAACGGSGDGSAVNPKEQPPTDVEKFAIISGPSSVNNTWGAKTGLNPNTKFVLLSGTDEVDLGSGKKETHVIHYLTTDTEFVEKIINGDDLFSLDVATTTAFDYIDLTNTSNVVQRSSSITETDPTTIYNPYLYQHNYGDSEHVQIYFSASRKSDDYLKVSASGPQFVSLPSGEITFSGRSVIHRVDNTNTSNNSPLGTFRETSVEGGTFTLSIDASQGTGTFESTSSNSTVLSSNIIVDKNSGIFTSENTEITFIGKNYTGRLDGALHDDSLATTGIFVSTDTSPTVVGAFAGVKD